MKNFFVRFFCVFLPPLLNIFCIWLGPYHFCPYCAHLCMKCSLGISNFLDEISSLSHSIVFLYFFPLLTEEGFLISPCFSLELCIQMGVSFIFSFAFCFSSFHSYFALFFFLGMVLIPVFSTMLRTSVHSPSGTLVYQI